MGLRSLEYEDTTKPDTRQGAGGPGGLLVCTRVWNPSARIRDHENPTTTTPTPRPRPWVYVVT
ncbi:hypothetical protein ACQXZU_09715, partial [Corynebacterium diphtheriae]